VRLIYQKIDSTFLGNPRAEIHAAMESCGFACAIVAPALPAMGRTVIGGRLHVAKMGGTVDLRERLHSEGGALHVAVVDAVSQEDLARIARVALTMYPRPLIAGSAGLAIELAALLAEAEGKHPASPARDQRGGLALLCIGSRNPVTKRQVEHLLKAECAVVRSMDPLSVILALRDGRNVVVWVDLCRSAQPSPADFISLLEDRSAGAVVLSGGDTAIAVCRALGVQGIRLEREILTGIPVGRLVGGRAEGLPVVTKAGGFGAEDALIRVTEFLSKHDDISVRT
jgi:uncharacterized protein YgbK (DUF1537 family)